MAILAYIFWTGVEFRKPPQQIALTTIPFSPRGCIIDFLLLVAPKPPRLFMGPDSAVIIRALLETAFR
jgi:hypothetical protein